MSLPNIKINEARFLHPSELGMNYPLLTNQQLYQQTSALKKALIIEGLRKRNIVGKIVDGKYTQIEKPPEPEQTKKQVCIQGPDGVWRPVE